METKNILLSISLPYPRIIDKILGFDLQVLIRKLSEFFQVMYTNVPQHRETFRNKFSLSNFNPKFNKKKFLQLLLPVLLFVVIVGSLVAYLNRPVTTNVSNTVLGSKERSKKIQLEAPLAILTLNREFIFPIKDEKGKTVDTFTYFIENAELRDEIIVKGQRATSVEGRTFLIVNLKIINKSNQRVSLNARDYIRLSANNRNDELLAPDIHNDPVEIQAISTKYTRLGFPINESDINLKLYVGEIDGEKQTIDLTFN